MEREKRGRASAIGLAAPGLVAPDERAIAYMPGRLAGLEGFDWTRHLERDEPVRVLNDAQAALLGEVWVGAGRGRRNVVMFTLGTGVGGAAMVDGRLLRGQIGRAGHLGHMSLNPRGVADICGTPGSLETVIGNCTIAERSGGRFATTHDLVRAYSSADPDAARVWLESLRGLAAGIASAINILDPAVVILGGGISRSGPALFDPLNRYLDEMEWRPGGHRVPLVAAQLGEHAGALGAAWNALRPA
jgi:glucokinase